TRTTSRSTPADAVASTRNVSFEMPALGVVSADSRTSSPGRRARSHAALPAEHAAPYQTPRAGVTCPAPHPVLSRARMERSERRILTTHAGSLPRPKPLVEMLVRQSRREDVDVTALAAAVRDATRYVVKRQLEAGIDVGNDGE